MTAPASSRQTWSLSVIDTLRHRLSRVPLSLLQLLMRVAIEVPLFDPTLMARMATFNELTFSTLLFLGLATRLATVPFLGMIVVIQTFVYPNAWIEHLVWTSILLVLLTRGGGALSVDHLLARRGGATRL